MTQILEREIVGTMIKRGSLNCKRGEEDFYPRFPTDPVYIAIEINSKYLFSWDNVPGNDSGRLLKFLMNDLDIVWSENAEIRKSDDGKIIRIFKDKNSAEIMIDKKEEKATLKISDGRTHDLKVKKENGKLIYTPNKFSDPIETHVDYYSQTITRLPRLKLKKTIRDWIKENYNIGDFLVIETTDRNLYRFRLPSEVSDRAL